MHSEASTGSWGGGGGLEAVVEGRLLSAARPEGVVKSWMLTDDE